MFDDCTSESLLPKVFESKFGLIPRNAGWTLGSVPCERNVYCLYQYYCESSNGLSDLFYKVGWTLGGVFLVRKV